MLVFNVFFQDRLIYTYNLADISLNKYYKKGDLLRIPVKNFKNIHFLAKVVDLMLGEENYIYQCELVSVLKDFNQDLLEKEGVDLVLKMLYFR